MKRSLLPTLADFLAILLLLLVVLAGGRRLFGDSDAAWHVAAGNWILEHRQAPRSDPFLATGQKRPWIAYEWLSDAGLALVYRGSGWPGVAAVSGLLIAAAHFLLFRFLVRRGDDPVSAFLAVVGAAVAASSHWLARPHLVTVLFLVIWTLLLDDVAEGRRPPLRLALLPPLQILWTNLHGGFLMGPLVLGCYWLGNLIAARPQGGGRKDREASALRARSIILPFTAAGAASLAAMLVNPYGWRLPAHIIRFFSFRRAHLAAIEEFAPPSLQDRAGGSLFFFLALTLAGLFGSVWAARASRRAHPEKLPHSEGIASFSHPGLLLAFGMGSLMALRSVRNAEIAAIFSALILAGGASSVLRLLLDSPARSALESLRRHEARGGGGAFAAAALALLALARIASWPPTGFDPEKFPVRMVEALKKAGVAPSGPVLAPDWWGGYLILEWPEARVFVDGRSDMFGDDFLEGYAAIYRAAPGWPRRLDQAGIDWILLPPDAPLAEELARDPGWERWGADAAAIVFRRGSAHARLNRDGGWSGWAAIRGARPE
jgi:hypothetical protein